MLKKILNKIKKYRSLQSSSAYISYLRKKRILIGENCVFRSPKTTRIDITRPCLITIGDNVDMNMNFQILTHDWASLVFRNVYHELISSSGKVTIGNNIYFGTNVIVLKGVTIGDNCIIGAGSIVAKDIPANSVAAGTPARRIYSLDEYFEKRKKQHIEEAFEYARAITERYHRLPTVEDFWEEFPLFTDGNQTREHTDRMIKQLGAKYPLWAKKHKAVFYSFDEFLKAAKIKNDSNS